MLEKKYNLTKDNKAAWEKLCQSDSNIPIFMQSFWMDTVCNTWTVHTVHDFKNEMVGAIVFHYKRKFGLSLILNPNMTPYHGLWIKEKFYFKEKNKITVGKEISNLLISSLPKTTYTNLRLSSSIIDTQIFKWKGFDTKVRYTYLIKNTTNKEESWANFDQKTRNSIIKASNDLICSEYTDINQHFDIVQGTFHKVKENLIVDVETFTKMYENLHPLSKSFLFCVKDKSDKIHASLLLIRDSKTAYLTSHGFVHNAHRGATSLLIWKAIEYACENQINLDFEGSDLPKIEPFYRGFGGEITPYYQVVRAKNKFWKLIFTLVNKM
jgi:lipid II:glycine glycyltransferase (peptidoglycan interpeptide bridge formation enzyme)